MMWPTDPVVDRLAPKPILKHGVLHHGMIFDLVADQVDLGDAGVVTREYITHPGAVAIIAMDDHDRVIMVHQYRHPTGFHLWEPPAGLLDKPGEPPVEAAQRELAEEADLIASEWHVLVDYFLTPGSSDETVRVFLARGLRTVPELERHHRDHEELDMPTRWVPLDEAVAGVLAGRIHNPSAVVGLLTAVAARNAGWSTLRPVDAPWPQHKAYRGGATTPPAERMTTVE